MKRFFYILILCTLLSFSVASADTYITDIFNGDQINWLREHSDEKWCSTILTLMDLTYNAVNLDFWEAVRDQVQYLIDNDGYIDRLLDTGGVVIPDGMFEFVSSSWNSSTRPANLNLKFNYRGSGYDGVWAKGSFTVGEVTYPDAYIWKQVSGSSYPALGYYIGYASEDGFTWESNLRPRPYYYDGRSVEYYYYFYDQSVSVTIKSNVECDLSFDNSNFKITSVRDSNNVDLVAYPHIQKDTVFTVTGVNISRTSSATAIQSGTSTAGWSYPLYCSVKCVANNLPPSGGGFPSGDDVPVPPLRPDLPVPLPNMYPDTIDYTIDNNIYDDLNDYTSNRDDYSRVTYYLVVRDSDHALSIGQLQDNSLLGSPIAWFRKICDDINDSYSPRFKFHVNEVKWTGKDSTQEDDIVIFPSSNIALDPRDLMGASAFNILSWCGVALLVFPWLMHVYHTVRDRRDGDSIDS